uniref:hypothetical protein n=1 Tax=Nonomuraea bangladeshensis TaxID=404385 RepID=UPI003F496429
MGTCQWLCCPSQVPAGTPNTRASEPARTTTALERGQILLLEHVRDLLRHRGELPRWLRRYLPFLRGLLTAVRMAAPLAGPVLAGVTWRSARVGAMSPKVALSNHRHGVWWGRLFASLVCALAGLRLEHGRISPAR